MNFESITSCVDDAEMYARARETTDLDAASTAERFIRSNKLICPDFADRAHSSKTPVDNKG